MPPHAINSNDQIKSKLIYNLLWNTKSRQPILEPQIISLLETNIKSTCRLLQIAILDLSISPTTVSLKLRCPPNLSPAQIVTNLKVRSSNKLKSLNNFTYSPVWSKAYLITCDQTELSRPTIAKFHEDEELVESRKQDRLQAIRQRKRQERIAEIDEMMDRVFAECAEREKAEAEAAKNRPPSPYGTYDPNRPGGWG